MRVAPHRGSTGSETGISDFSARVVRRRWLVVPAYLAGAGLVDLSSSAGALGREIFPTVDAGQFQLRLRAAAGTRIEETEQLANKTLDVDQPRGRPGERRRSPSATSACMRRSYPINAIYQWTGGPEEAVLRVQLKPEGAASSRGS